MKTITLHVARATFNGNERFVASAADGDDANYVTSALNRLNSLWSNKHVTVETAQQFEVGDVIEATIANTCADEDGIDHVVGHQQIRGTITETAEHDVYLTTEAGRLIVLPKYALNGCASVLSNIKFS